MGISQEAKDLAKDIADEIGKKLPDCHKLNRATRKQWQTEMLNLMIFLDNIVFLETGTILNHSRDEIGEAVELTAPRIRQLEQTALLKIRKKQNMDELRQILRDFASEEKSGCQIHIHVNL